MKKNRKMSKYRLIFKRSKCGFTLVEMMVAVAVFSIVLVFSTGTLLSVMAANKQAQAVKTVVSNLNYALETMVRGIRSGFDYDCVPDTSDLDQCSVNPSSEIGFIDQNGLKVIYRLSEGGQLLRDVYDVASGIFISKDIPITSGNVVIDRMDFYVRDVESATRQPSVIILVGGKMFTKKGNSVKFDVETMAVQRLFNK